MKFKTGQKVKMSEDALENYGEKYRDLPLTITHSAHSYMPADEFFAKNRPVDYHPGYDDGVKGQGLYDFDSLEFSLYDWELIRI